MPRPYRRWTAAEDESVRTRPPAEAARQTGRPLAAVYGRRHRLHAATGKRPWTAAEDVALLQFPAGVAARRLGRTLDSVKIRRWRLGLTNLP